MKREGLTVSRFENERKGCTSFIDAVRKGKEGRMRAVDRRQKKALIGSPR